MTRLQINLTLFLLLYNSITFGQSDKQNDYWLLFSDTTKDDYGYRNQQGDTVIQLGKYSICYTDTFWTYAIVLKPHTGFVAIDRQQNVLYKVFPFDNGPDDTSDGLFRILNDNKIGYADAITGKVIIQPQFDCAFPFENGLAKVSIHCSIQPEDEHKAWISDSWFYIDKTGKKVNRDGSTK